MLRKHEEEIVLVKSEQKRKITVLQDTINKLRQRVRTTNDEITKEENHLHDIINDIRRQLENLYKKKRAYRYVMVLVDTDIVSRIVSFKSIINNYAFNDFFFYIVVSRRKRGKILLKWLGMRSKVLSIYIFTFY